MTAEEAINVLTNAKNAHSQRAGIDFIKALNVAISALEKQIPKKPNRSGTYHVCPNCNHFINKNESKYGKIDIPHCKWCGQALDWSDTE